MPQAGYWWEMSVMGIAKLCDHNYPAFVLSVHHLVFKFNGTETLKLF
jgi:hypothetical protein